MSSSSACQQLKKIIRTRYSGSPALHPDLFDLQSQARWMGMHLDRQVFDARLHDLLVATIVELDGVDVSACFENDVISWVNLLSTQVGKP